MAADSLALPSLDAAARQAILGFARQLLQAHLQDPEHGPQGVPEPDVELLRQPWGLFVTLRQKGELRGCIGNLEATEPVATGLRGNLILAATADPRFPPVRPQEESGIRIEVSILSRCSDIQRPGEVIIGRHGIRLETPRGTGILLPQVATRFGLDAEGFLEQVAIKAGLGPQGWRGARIQVFRCLVLEEE